MTRPWNLPNVPVYSLVTDGSRGVNMNICTYVSPVSMKPKRYIVAVYHNTQTLSNLKLSKTVVLQLLAKQHVSLVNVLGKRSGLEFDKAAFLKKKNVLGYWKEHSVLNECAALLELKKRSSTNAGDHTLFLFDVTRFKTNHRNILTLDHLRSKKLIRI